VGRVWPRHGHRGRPLNSVVMCLKEEMLKTFFILLTGLFLATSAESALTTNQLNEFKDSIKQGCVSRGLERGADEKYVNSFCGCMDTVLRENLSDADYEEMAMLASRSKTPEEMPAFRNLLPRLEACKRANNNT
jgi:hypothetical protein